MREFNSVAQDRSFHRPIRQTSLVTSLALGLGAATTAFAQPVSETPEQTSKTSPTIVVTGTRDSQPQLDRIVTPIVDTPQAISILSSEDLANRGISNLNDALRNVAGISLGAGETSFQGNNAILRGFTTRNDLFLDNIRDFGFYYRDTFDDAAIEVLKGPSSILFGRGSTGGVIHRVGKKPREETFGQIEASLGLNETRRIVGDLNVANAIGGADFRVTAVYHESMVEDRDTASSQRWAVSPKLGFQLGADTKLLLSYFHQEEDNVPDYGIPFFPGTRSNPGAPAAVRRSNYYGFTNDFFDTNVHILTARLEHRVSEKTLFRSQFRFSNNTRGFRYSEAIIALGTPRTTPLSAITVSRNLFEGSSTDEFLQNQTDVTTEFALGKTNHTLIAGVELGRESADPVFITNFAVPSTSLTNPVGGFFDNRATSFVRLRARSRSNAVGFFAIDTVEIGDSWRAIVGLRWDSFRTKYDSAGFNRDRVQIATTNVDRTDRNLSYRAALVYKPATKGSIFLAYANSFNPSGEGVESLISAGRSVAQANINLEPETSTSIEFGTKWNFFGDKVLFSTSIFRIEKDNVRVPDPTTAGFNTLGGLQRVDGGEIEFSGEVAAGWSISASYSYLDSQTLKSSPNGPLVGEPLNITPRHMGNFSTSYDFTPKLNIGFNLLAVSQRLAQNTPASFLTAPSYTIADISAKYRFSKKVTASVIVYNLGDKLYYEQLHPVHVIPGAGRTALATVKVGF